MTENWAYDPAGNRHDTGSGFSNWTFDNLNRLTASPGLTYSNDILGNRLSNSATSNGWDQLNRMTSFTSGTVTTNYSYRADGMRVEKSDNNGNSTSFAYDGQMGFEDNEPQGNNEGVTDYGIGPRGIDRIAFTNGSGTSVSYPIYDGHGNMTCTLTASGGNCNAANNERQYDAWGEVVYGQGALDPKGRYCANLGHKQDDESGLIYMRARYYDPSCGRFVSEDLEQSGLNWFVYCDDCPVSGADVGGNSPASFIQGLAMIWGLLFGAGVGFAVCTLLLEALNPGYKVDTIIQTEAEGFFAGLASTIVMAIADPTVNPIASGDITRLAAAIQRSLAQTGYGPAASAGGIAFVAGLLLGILDSVYEYYLSDYYQDPDNSSS